MVDYIGMEWLNEGGAFLIMFHSNILDTIQTESYATIVTDKWEASVFETWLLIKMYLLVGDDSSNVIHGKLVKDLLSTFNYMLILSPWAMSVAELVISGSMYFNEV
jgi:hypothetical protein